MPRRGTALAVTNSSSSSFLLRRWPSASACSEQKESRRHQERRQLRLHNRRWMQRSEASLLPSLRAHRWLEFLPRRRSTDSLRPPPPPLPLLRPLRFHMWHNLGHHRLAPAQLLWPTSLLYLPTFPPWRARTLLQLPCLRRQRPRIHGSSPLPAWGRVHGKEEDPIPGRRMHLLSLTRLCVQSTLSTLDLMRTAIHA
jgi:hypothetical protein